MAKQIKTSIDIHASRERIWSILTDFEKYPGWNPFITSISGELKLGNRLRAKIQGMVFTPIVLTLNKNVELKWLGHLWFKGLFDGEHRFYLSDNGDGTTNFEQSEVFSGILVGLFAKNLDKNTKSGFEEMNERLKKRAENTDVNIA